MAQPSWVPPSEFEEYRLLRRLGHGAMGQVWLARDTLLERTVALKFIGSRTREAAVRERFLNEARAIARLSHPNVVGIHRVGTIDDQPFIVSEWVEGESLDRVARPIAPATLLRIAVDLARGLAAAHRAGVLHRDVKPANAMLSVDGVAKLLDFGLAKAGDDGPPTAPTATPQRAATTSGDSTIDAPLTSPSGAKGAALTQAGARLGTPLYWAPECWRGEPASRRSDVFSMGALLYELAAGKPPLRFLEGEELDALSQRPAKPLREVAPNVEHGFASVVDRCVQLTADARLPDGDALREALEALLSSRAARPAVDNPYRGLSAFEAEHRGLFFGRASEVRAACDRLRSSSLLVVAGESGVGKSSLCRAGVLPELEAGALGGRRKWVSAVSLPGRHPLRSLISACANTLPLSVETLLVEARTDARALARAVLRQLGPGEGLVVFVDQLEEWVTFAERDEAEAAARALAALCDGLPAVRVVATLRTDLLGSLTALPELPALLSASLFLLGPVRPEELAEVIEAPARAFAVTFETRELVRGLVDFAASGGALPLLQFALARLWERRGDSTQLTERALAALGGVSGALAAHADSVVETLPAPQREAARRLLTALVTNEDRRVRRLESELANGPLDHDTLSSLARARLIVPRDSPEGRTWELAHEALVRAWGTLRGWLANDAEALAQRERLDVGVREWKRQGRTSDTLWSARQLADFERVFESLPPSLSDESRTFLKDSARAIRLRRWRLPGAIAVLVLAAAGTFGATRAVQAARLQAEVERHFDIEREAAQSAAQLEKRTSAATATALSHFDRGEFPDGEKAWVEVRALQRDWSTALQRDLGELEAVQLLSSTEARLGPRLVELARGQLAWAAQTRVEPQLEPLQRRLDALGQGDALRSLRTAKASVKLTVEPADAELELTQMVELDARAKMLEKQPAQAGAPMSLEPGSWVLSASAPGFASARLPFVVGHGDTRELELRLVPTARVPAGFVHIPAGRSLVGSAGDDVVRRDFYWAAPLHSVDLPSFFMGRTEVSFGEWLVWLEALPPEERAQRTPRLDANAGMVATARLALSKKGARWWLDFTFDGNPYAALDGDSIHYPARETHADQAWVKMPVVGVTVLDALAYAQWLDATGRVPGARLCTEYEWERAARGADGRTLPQGESMEPDDADIDVTYGRKEGGFGPDEVGTHPGSRSVFGIDDLQGNVWEFVRPANAHTTWTTKGGSWQTSVLSSRLPNQSIVNAAYRQLETGVRLCADVR